MNKHVVPTFVLTLALIAAGAQQLAGAVPQGGSVNATVNVKDFGAVGDGEADDTVAIQAALDSLTLGGEVFLPAGKYKVSRTIQVGNGSDSRAATRNAIKLRGSGIAPYLKGSGTQLSWAGAAGGTVVTFNGTGDGFGLDGIQIDCNSIAGFGIRLYSIRNSTFTNFSIRDFRTTGLSLGIRTGPTATVLFGSGNLFSNYIVTSYQASVVSGLAITGNYSGKSDWFRNVFMNGIVQIQNSASSTASAGYIEFADHNAFVMCDFSVAGNGTAHGLMLNSANSPNYPQNNFFSGGSITNVSTYETDGSVIGNNFFSPFTTADGETIPAHSKLRGISDAGTVFGSFGFTSSLSVRKTFASLDLSNAAGKNVWHLLNNANEVSEFGFQISKTTGAVTTPYYQIDNNGDSYVYLSGVGLRKIVIGPEDSGGAGYRLLRVAN